MAQDLSNLAASAGAAGAVSCRYPSRLDVPRPNLDELLGTVAHELRNPLASMLTGVNLLTSECAPDPVARWALGGMKHQLQHAMRLVDDLFDICAGGLGKMSLCKQLVTFNELMTSAAETARPLLIARQHRLTVTLPPGPVFLEADPLRLHQVLMNLLCNAAKFTDLGGHIHLSAATEWRQIALRVRDNGRGIAPNLLPQVFDRFQQLPGRKAAGTGGLGIGLALVKSLVELHGGSVAAHSDGPVTGAEFVVRLPIAAAPPKQRSQAP
jgi:signal transduction histidine kinase